VHVSQLLFGIITGLQTLEHELLLFVAFWFVLGALDEFAIDVCWIALCVAGKGRDGKIAQGQATAPLEGRAAILIAAWREAEVIGHTVRHALSAWSQQGFTLYVGCYPNDPGTIAEAVAAAAGDPRLRVVINCRPGPTTKADCLNTVYSALCDDEARNCWRFRSVLLHDAEDMVHPAELAVIDEALARADFVHFLCARSSCRRRPGSLLTMPMNSPNRMARQWSCATLSVLQFRRPESDVAFRVKSSPGSRSGEIGPAGRSPPNA